MVYDTRGLLVEGDPLIKRTESEVIPVCRPMLPDVDRLTPYLRRIDSTRVYSNWGPLASELETRLAAHIDLAEGAISTAASGTSALVGAILAAAGRATSTRPLALIPGFTFVATALAAEQCGYRVCFLDVDPESWLLDPHAVRQHPLIAEVGLVVPVAAFGRGVPQAPWIRFRQECGIPVVIDGGASFENVGDAPNQYLGKIPVTLSFHATKSFSTGEGGCVIASDTRLMESVVRALNFGFLGSRECRSASTNGKMSEYHAAVGLAELDGWQAKRERFVGVAKEYRDRFDRAGLRHRLVTAPTIASCYALLESETEGLATDARERLDRSRVEYRAWYGSGGHQQPHYATLGGPRLPVSEALCARVTGLPMACDLSLAAVDRVVSALADSR